MAEDHFTTNMWKPNEVDWHFLIRLNNQSQIRDVVKRYAKIYDHPGLYPPIPFEWLHMTILRIGSVANITDQGSRSAPGGIERTTGEDRLQRGEQRLALLAKRREIAAQAGECVRARIAAEAARDLLVHLEGPQIPLSLVIVEGNGEVLKEGQRLVLPQP